MLLKIGEMLLKTGKMGEMLLKTGKAGWNAIYNKNKEKSTDLPTLFNK